MYKLFLWSGRLAVTLLVMAGATGLFAAFFRKIIKGPRVLTIHKWCGLGAVLFGVIHGFVYYFFMR